MYAIYLRKSRADVLAGDKLDMAATLEMHEKTLTELARRLGLPVGEIYREVVSGETIAARPVMMRLLSEVEQGRWEGVLVMEIERLARGDTMDQGLIAQTFKYSGTKIITPAKTYDPANEFDEEYFEFGLFMSRREYKTINRRQQRGRAAASEAGKYIANKPPYGYDRYKLEGQKGWSLKPNPQQAEVVKLIFDLYVNERIGPTKIAHRLDEIGIPTPTPKNKFWSQHTIRGVLRNPTYTGKIRSGERPTEKSVKDGLVVKSRPHNADCNLYQGLHEAIIDEAIYKKAQDILKTNTTGSKLDLAIQNPLAGLVICAECGRKMVRRPYEHGKPDSLICQNNHCKTISSHLYLVEERVLKALANWLEQYKFEIETQADDSQTKRSALDKTISNLENEIETLQQQMNRMYDLLEQGVYTPEVFSERSTLISQKLNEAKAAKQNAIHEIASADQRRILALEFIPRVENVISVYHQIESPADKNKLLKEVIDRVIYEKKLRGNNTGKNADAFEITLFPKVPR